MGYGERLVFVGHDVAILVPGDLERDLAGDLKSDLPAIFFAEDWNAQASAPAVLDTDGDAAFLDGFGKPYRWAKVRAPRCSSERARAERIFARDFKDRARVRP